MNKLTFILLRLIFGAFILLTSIYCLLVYIPFSYYAFIKPGLVSWVADFAKYHSYLYWPAFAAAFVTLMKDLRKQETRSIVAAFFIFHSAIGLLLLFKPLLPNLESDRMSLIYGVAAQIPLLWLGAIDLFVKRNAGWGESEREDRSIFRASIAAGLFLPLLYSAIYRLRYGSGAANFSGGQNAVALLWSAASHLLIFTALFVALNLMRAVAKAFRSPAKVEYLICCLSAAFLIALGIQHTVFTAVSFAGAVALFLSYLSAISITIFLAGIGIRLQDESDGPITSGISLFFKPFAPVKPSWFAFAAFSISLAVVAYILAVKIPLLDWNFLIQKLSVAAIWTLAFALFYRTLPEKNWRSGRAAVLLIAAVLPLAFYKTLDIFGQKATASLSNGSIVVNSTLEKYAGFDVSFKVARELLTPERAENDAGFYEYLQRNTNIPASVKIDPVDVNLVENLSPNSGEKPNIFIIVIDSLRRDYLSPYNSKVTFTPSIDRFARESVVMENSFTRYGATGLSEPSIWVGSEMVHKQYVTPFHPMNSLQKLIEAENYQSFISLDTILKIVVKPSPNITPLDENVQDKDLDLCRSLADLQGKISKREDLSRPIFAYTQPQNIHISAINREGRSVPPGEQYPGFYAPYASRLKRIDACFGEFIEFLKKNGIYDKSIVILTADHGDSLGEEGRWGHAYTIFPEILRIPLIVHLPQQMREKFQIDARTISFSTDITPTLYRLLGHGPTLNNELFGRPLFTLSKEEQIPYIRDHYLVASSYGAVYGILKDGGRSLYIADGVNYNNYIYEIGEKPEGEGRSATAAENRENQKLIREGIGAINRFYKFERER